MMLNDFLYMNWKTRFVRLSIACPSMRNYDASYQHLDWIFDTTNRKKFYLQNYGTFNAIDDYFLHECSDSHADFYPIGTVICPRCNAFMPPRHRRQMMRLYSERRYVKSYC